MDDFVLVEGQGGGLTTDGAAVVAVMPGPSPATVGLWHLAQMLIKAN